MKAYIDFRNIQSLLEQKEDPRYEDCVRVLQKQIDVHFNFEKHDIISEQLLAWFKYFSSGVGQKSKQVFSNDKFPDRPLKSNTYLGFDGEQLGSIYLLDDDRVDVLKEVSAILLGSPGEELAILSALFLHNDDYKFDKKLKIGGDELSNWNDLAKYPFQSSDILIFDPYILSDGPAIMHNLLPLLSILSSKSRCKINVVIYTKYQEGYLTYNDVKNHIRGAVKAKTGKNINLTIIMYRDQKNVSSPQAEHDRTIFTNYARYYSGDTFNYWNEDGTIRTKGRELHIASYANRENHTLALELIDEIQGYVESLPGEMIEGDKKSNFLTFK